MEQYQESFEVQAMLMTENGKWQQAATMQRAARSASKPGEQRGWPLPSKLPRRGRATGAHHHLEGAADGGDSDDWETDGAVL